MTPAASPQRVLLISDFSPANLQALLARSTDPLLEPSSAPLDTVYQTLLAPPEADAALLWTRPESVIPGFAALLAGELADIEAILEQVDRFIEAVLTAQAKLPVMLVASWTQPWYRRGLGMLDLKAPGGAARALLAMNGRLVERLAPVRDVFVLDASRWARAAGPRGDSPSGWYVAKLPYSPDALKIAAADVAAALRGLRGGARKLLVVDLDDTLWGGILGDLGWEGLSLGGHDPKGEAHQDFQRALRSLARRGVVLAIASKNDEAVALDGIRRHPEMVLREQDFASWRINWRDKASNIVEIAEELNLGLQHVVFIDDNPSERGRVRETLPDVLVPDWPADPLRYVSALEALDCFDQPSITDEDRARGAAYHAERQRQTALSTVRSVEDWLADLQLVITVEPLREATLVRATQLLNKTNQMNLTTRRLTGLELERWAATPGNACWTVTVADRFGEAGLTGLVAVSVAGTRATLQDFVLSCRVFGRQVEETMLHLAVDHAAAAGARVLVADFMQTAKNKPTLEFLRDRSRLTSDEANTYRWDCRDPYPVPSHVTLRRWERGA